MTQNDSLKDLFAIVGPNGAGKTTLFNNLIRVLDPQFVTFLTDSGEMCDANAEHIPFTRLLSASAQEGLHKKTTPLSELLYFWARLHPVVRNSLLGSLRHRHAIMNGFGGTILANALVRATSDSEREDLIETHKFMIRKCVIGTGVKAPKAYILLKPNPKEALERLVRTGRYTPDLTLEKIEKLIEWFEFYGSLPGQNVEVVDAGLPPKKVLEIALKIIGLPLKEEAVLTV